MKLTLSVVIPAFNEVKRITPTLDSVRSYLHSRGITHEIIVVDDGSTDGTSVLIKQLSSRIPRLILIQHSRNQGKGASVKTGMLAAKGDMLLFMDADNSTAIVNLDKLLPCLAQGYEIVVGSRRIEGSSILVKQQALREALGHAFRLLSHTMVPIDVVDTQNGFKLFSRMAAKKLFSKLKINGWSFDIELLVRAKREGLKIKEVPIIWTNDVQSRMRFSHMVRMFIDLLRIRFLRF